MQEILSGKSHLRGMIDKDNRRIKASRLLHITYRPELIAPHYRQRQKNDASDEPPRTNLLGVAWTWKSRRLCNASSRL